MARRSLPALLTSLASRFKSLWSADSRPAAAMSGAPPHAALFAALFPGQHYSEERAGELAVRLRAIATELEQRGAPQQPVEQQPADGTGGEAGPSKKRKKEREGRAPKELDFSAYHSRYVALELLYLGGRYQGFATQADTEETIEGHLFRAMKKTRLVRQDATWQDMHYSRGGRTDKGVSALGQVVALNVRSAGRADQPLPGEEAEMDYPTVLNRALPPDIRVTGWAAVPEDFSARFSASHREYKYFVLQEGGLDVARMAEAAAHFVGEHDFRNFCKVDAQHVATFRRTILDFRIQRVEGCGWGNRQLYELYIRGTAFLWHQVRCMAAVLFMVGRGEEDPSVVASLLDVAAHPCKPQYTLAAEEPLLLYCCAYRGLAFRRTPSNQDAVRAALAEMLNRQLIAAGMLSTILERLAKDETLPEAAAKKRNPGPRYIKLLQRPTGPPLEERFAKYGRSLEAPGSEGGGGGGGGQKAAAVAAGMETE